MEVTGVGRPRKRINAKYVHLFNRLIKINKTYSTILNLDIKIVDIKRVRERGIYDTLVRKIGCA